MKYLKLFENVTNYKVEVLTGKELTKLYFKLYPKQQVNLKDKIHYFNWNDVDSWSGGEKHRNCSRFITAYNNKDILGVCLFSWWDSGNHYSVSYLSTNKDYFKMGISKRILDVLFKYFSETYPDDIMYWSGYSIDGWKYLHPTILEMSKKYSVKVREKHIEYFKGWDDETREIVDKSEEEIKKLYPDWYAMYR